MKKICHILIALFFMFFIIGCETPTVLPPEGSEDPEQHQRPSESQESEENKNNEENSSESQEEDNNEENQNSNNQEQESYKNEESEDKKEEEIEELYVEEYDNKTVVGEGNYEEFYQRTINQEKLRLKVKETYVIHPENYSKEYYEQIKDEYPKTVEYVITYDGEVYKIESSYATEEIYKYFKYSVTVLKHREDLRFARTYLFTNDENVTYELYNYYLTSSKWEDAIKSFESFLFVFKVCQAITYEDTKFLNIDYFYDEDIMISKENENKLFYYLDNLMWGQLENFNSDNYKPSDNIINISTKRTIKDIVLETPLELNKEYQVDYVIDIDNHVVNVLFKDNGKTVYSIFADSESSKLKELLEDINIDFKYTYIEPSSYYGTIENEYIVKVEMLEEDITFIYEYKDQKMVIYGKYKVFGDKLLCELDMDDPLDGYYSMETYLFTYTINEEGIEHSNPYARTWFKDFEYYVTKIMLKKIQN